MAVDQLARLEEGTHAVKVAVRLPLHGQPRGGNRGRRLVRREAVGEVWPAPGAMMRRVKRRRVMVACRAGIRRAPVVVVGRVGRRRTVDHGQSCVAVGSMTPKPGSVVYMVRVSIWQVRLQVRMEGRLRLRGK